MIVSIIVIKCKLANDPSFPETGNSVYGDRIVDRQVDSTEIGLSLGNQFRADGMCVLVRPHGNEKDAQGKRFFREWHSFNGEPFKEIRFTPD